MRIYFVILIPAIIAAFPFYLLSKKNRKRSLAERIAEFGILLLAVLSVSAAINHLAGNQDIRYIWNNKSFIYINEVCTNNRSILTDGNAASCDYVEIYNNSLDPYSIEGWFLSDDPERLLDEQIGEVVIEPSGYALIYLGGTADAFSTSVDLALDRKGETLYLCDSEGNIVDSVAVPELPPDCCFARTMNAGEEWAVSSPSPSADNDVEDRLRFSVDSGFYEEPFYLEILGGKELAVYYTLDGSKPTPESTLYTGPVLVDDASRKENVYSGIANTSPVYYSELIEKYSTPPEPEYKLPAEKVDKCSVVRAVAYNKDQRPVYSIQSSYFVGYENKDAYNGLYILSVISDPENFFDYDRGIYVTGYLFDDFLERLENNALSKFEEETLSRWWWWTSNYCARGMDSERDAYIELFQDDGSLLLNQACGVRVQGGATRGYPMKSLGFFARDAYSGDRLFPADIFDTGYHPHKFVAFSGGNDCAFKIRDYLVQNLTSGLAFSTMKLIPCAVFLDGEYWGFYFLAENYNANYIYGHYGIEEDNVIMIKTGQNALGEGVLLDLITEGDESDQKLFLEMRSFISENDMRDPENYQAAQRMIDLDSYVDYYAAQIYISRRSDWPKGNIALWRARSDTGSEYGDERWRWMLFDVNYGGLTVNDISLNSIDYVKKRDAVFNSLVQNEDFRRRLVERLAYISSVTFSQDRVDAVIGSYLDNLLVPISRNSVRYFGGERLEDITEAAENLRTFFQGRAEYVKKSIGKSFGGEYLEIWDKHNA